MNEEKATILPLKHAEGRPRVVYPLLDRWTLPLLRRVGSRVRVTVDDEPGQHHCQVDVRYFDPNPVASLGKG